MNEPPRTDKEEEEGERGRAGIERRSELGEGEGRPGEKRCQEEEEEEEEVQGCVRKKLLLRSLHKPKAPPLPLTPFFTKWTSPSSSSSSPATTFEKKIRDRKRRGCYFGGMSTGVCHFLGPRKPL